MQIAAFPKCWIEEIVDGRMSLFDWIEQSKALEVDGLELYAEFLESHEPAYLARVRSAVEDAGMTIPMMCYSPDFTVPDEAARAEEVARQKQVIAVTAALGGRFCRTLSGQSRPEVKTEDGIRWVTDSIRACLSEAERHDVVLVIENHYKDGYWKFREFAQRSDVLMPIVDAIDSPHFGVQYDPSNALVAGEDPLDVLDLVLRKVRTVHASDRSLKPGTDVEELRQSDGTLGYPDTLQHGITGKGANDYDEIFRRLVAVGFDGWVSIEDGMDGMAEMKASVDFLKSMRDRYART